MTGKTGGSRSIFVKAALPRPLSLERIKGQVRSLASNQWYNWMPKDLAQRFIYAPIGNWSAVRREFRRAVLEPGLWRDADDSLNDSMSANSGREPMGWLVGQFLAWIEHFRIQ